MKSSGNSSGTICIKADNVGKNGILVLPKSFDEFRVRVLQALNDTNAFHACKALVNNPIDLLDLQAKANDGRWMSFIDWAISLQLDASMMDKLRVEVGIAIESLDVMIPGERFSKHDRIWPNAKGALKYFKVIASFMGQKTQIKWSSRQAAMNVTFASLVEKVEKLSQDLVASRHNTSFSQKNRPEYRLEGIIGKESIKHGENIFSQFGIDKEQLVKDLWMMYSEKGCLAKSSCGSTRSFILPSGYRLKEACPPLFISQIVDRMGQK